MSHSPNESPRKSMDEGSTRSEPKRRPPRKDRGSRGVSTKNLPFTEPDPFFCDVTIVMNDKRLYTNMCILAYNSPVLRKHFAESDVGGGGGRGAKAKATTSCKDLDLSDSKHKYNDVVELLCCIDPRVYDRPFSDDSAIHVLPLVEEYEMTKIRNECEKKLTKSYRKMRKGRRPGMVPTGVTLEYLGVADKYDFDALLKMCIDDCVANDNPFANSAISDSRDLSEKVKVQLLNKKLDRVNMMLAKERRRKEGGEDEEEKKKPARNSWRI